MGGHRAYDIWSDMGIGIPYKVYLGSTIRGLSCQLGSQVSHKNLTLIK